MWMREVLVSCFPLLLFVLTLTGCATTSQPLVRASRTQGVPLALNCQFQLRKVQQFFNEPIFFTYTGSAVVNFERSSINYGAISRSQFNQLRGSYFSFLWRTFIKTDITVRFEYCQNALGNKIQALERYYPNAFGSYKSEFKVIGDSYLKFGRVIAWRVLLLVDGQIVAIRQSFLWK